MTKTKNVKRERVDAFVKQCGGQLSIAQQAKILGVSQWMISQSRKRLGLTPEQPRYMRRPTTSERGSIRTFWLTDAARKALRTYCTDRGVSMSQWLEDFIRSEMMGDGK